MKIAYLASEVTLPGSPRRRMDAFEHDRMMAALTLPFEARGMQVVDVDWADRDVDWGAYSAVIIGTTWDYWDRTPQFLSVLERIEAKTHLFNPSALVRWNSHKRYLEDLATRGAALIPTLWLEKADPASVAAAFETLGDDIVLKRQVGAGAHGQVRLRTGEPVPDMPYPMMVQPFLPQIQSEGEYSFVFIDGEFSHALLKQAADGDYRIQSSYGGYETPVAPVEADLAAATRIARSLDETPLYARVDMVRGGDGELLLMELELIEPYLYPLEGPELGPRMADAVLRRIV